MMGLLDFKINPFPKQTQTTDSGAKFTNDVLHKLVDNDLSGRVERASAVCESGS